MTKTHKSDTFSISSPRLGVVILFLLSLKAIEVSFMVETVVVFQWLESQVLHTKVTLVSSGNDLERESI